MPIDAVQRGNNLVPTTVIVDPTNTVANQNIVQPGNADTILYTSTYGPYVGSQGLLLNAAGTTDRQRSAPGTVGIPSVNTEGTKQSYSAAISGFGPVATPTDFWQITGSASKTIRVTRISISGISSSGASVATLLYKRSTANTGGTLTAATNVAHDSNNNPGSAVVNTYSASNPTTGTGALVRAGELTLPASGNNPALPLVWDFTVRNSQGMVLRGTAQSLCINWNGVAVPGGSALCIDVEWTEES